jgi:response regulator NasT
LLAFLGVKPRWRVVLVDDHVPSRVAVADAVGMIGGVIVAAGTSADEAPALVERHRPDVVILAIGLPDGDGVDAARAVMARAPCPIVVLTGRTDAGVVRRARDAGIMAFLVKPLRPEELEPAMELAVARFRELDTIRQENEDLKKAIESRKLVERAKGLLMERHGLSEAEAFRKIQKTAMDSRRPMIEVARALLLVERLEGVPTGRRQSSPP